MDKMAIARNITEHIRSNGMTQRELAEKLNVTEVTVSRYCIGRRLPTAYALYRMAKIFGCTMETLMEGIESEKSNFT